MRRKRVRNGWYSQAETSDGIKYLLSITSCELVMLHLTHKIPQGTDNQTFAQWVGRKLGFVLNKTDSDAPSPRERKRDRLEKQILE